MTRRITVVALALLAGCGGDDDEPSKAPPPPAPAPQARPDTETDTTPARPRKARVETVVEGLEIPWEIAFLPDGRALLTERPGRVRLLSRRLELREEPVADIDVNDTGEGGLLGLAVDPEFERNSFVYLYRTTDSGNEVLRYRFRDGRLAEDARILEGLEAAPIHDGGRIHFGPDDALYVSTGEAGNPALAQDRGSLNGKFLRIPNPREDSARPEVISLGHRNVQGFDWAPGTGRLVATEFGPDSDDEVNVIRKGRNYGWPEAQGGEGGSGFTPAVVTYEDVIAPSGGSFVSRRGSEWTGSFLFGALVGRHIRRVKLERGRAVIDKALFQDDFGRVRTVVEGPDGSLYALTSNRDGRGSPSEGDDRVIRIVPPG